MEFILSGRFIAGLLIGAAVYHLWMLKRAKSS